MSQNYNGERWAAVQINHGQVSDNRIEVSNFGRIRSFNKNSDGNILNGSLINGYKIIRLKFFTERDVDFQEKILEFKAQILKLQVKLRLLKSNKVNKLIINELELKIEKLKKAQVKRLAADWKKRSIHYHALIHRLVATYFLKQKSPEQNIVAHLDFDKLNNRVSNLKWMTLEENILHQKESPYVQAELASRSSNNRLATRNIKMTVTKVMLLKKLLNEGKTIDKLAKQFRITNTQVLRIKKGENWGDIPAAG